MGKQPIELNIVYIYGKTAYRTTHMVYIDGKTAYRTPHGVHRFWYTEIYIKTVFL